jgi:hypothetical protein
MLRILGGTAVAIGLTLAMQSPASAFFSGYHGAYAYDPVPYNVTYADAPAPYYGAYAYVPFYRTYAYSLAPYYLTYAYWPY